jgi:hypothetical protein
MGAKAGNEQCTGHGSYRNMVYGLNEEMKRSARQKIPAAQVLQARCDAWNEMHPVGTLVCFEGELGTAYTRTPAFVTVFGVVALLFLESRERPVNLEAIRAFSPSAAMAGPSQAKASQVRAADAG